MRRRGLRYREENQISKIKKKKYRAKIKDVKEKISLRQDVMKVQGNKGTKNIK
jgi:hypothetical protein